MARAKFIADESFELMISRAMAGTEQVARAALKAGADVIADRMKENLEGVISRKATGQLVASFGISPVKQDRDFNWNVHLGFDGYQTPGQVPFQLLARTFESGAVMGGRYTGKRSSSGKRETWKAKFGPEDYWRQPTHFAKNAVTATKAQAFDAMKRAAEKEFEKLTERSN